MSLDHRQADGRVAVRFAALDNAVRTSWPCVPHSGQRRDGRLVCSAGKKGVGSRFQTPFVRKRLPTPFTAHRAWSGPLVALVGVSVVKGRRGPDTLPKLVSWGCYSTQAGA